jgi:MHS family proline/betaine transporter-like MFS transporter
MTAAAGGATPPLTVGDVTITDEKTIRRAVGAAALGNVTEWYDFGVYAYLLPVALNTVFFSGLPPGAQTAVGLGAFAVSFLVRPIGGLFWGPLGDKLGRTKVLSMTIILMAISTFALGVFPTYAAVGIAAPMLLLVSRLVQGFSTGGEYGGAMTFIAEYTSDKRRGFFGSWLEFGTLTGYALGAGLVTVLSTVLPGQAMLSWGWRIPFLLALPIGIVGLLLRIKLEETPAFQELLEESEGEQGTPAGEAFKLIFTKYWKAFLAVGGIVIAWNVTNYMLTSYMPTYLESDLHDVGGPRIGEFTSQILQIIVLVVLMVIITFLGRANDRFGRKSVLMVGSIALIVLSVPEILLIQRGDTGSIFAGLMIMGLTLVCFSSTTPSTLPALFPTEIRYGGLSISFNLFVSAFGGTVGVIMSALVLATGNPNWPGYYLIAAGVVGVLAVLWIREQNGKPLPGAAPAVASEAEAKELVAASNDRH